jgi:tight adherence protein B
MSSLLFDSALGSVVVGLAVGCLILVAALVALAKPRGAWLNNRLQPYGGGGTAVATGPVERVRRARWRPQMERLYGVTESALDQTSAGGKLEGLTARANLLVPPAQILFWSVAAGVGLALVVSLLSGSILLAVVAFIVGVTGPFAWIGARGRRRLKAFELQLPDVLMTMAGSLKVGQSFDNSMRAIVDEGQAPASEEFGRVLNETRLGRPMDESLGAMADRIDSDDLRFVLMSVTIQREIGGSLAELFQTVSDTVRSRQHFRRKVSALTAMGRASAYLLVGLPFATAGLIAIINPGYLQPLLHNSVGQFMVIAALLMIVVGALVLKKIVSIKG